MEIISVLDAIDEGGLKVLVYGESGAGKTVLCATTGGTTIILSAEKGLRSLKQYAKQHPEVFKKIKIIVIKTIDDFKDAREMFEENTGEHQICEWLALDSISEIAEVLLSNSKKEEKDPRKSYGIMQERIAEECRKFRDLDGYNVLFTAKMQRITDEDTGRTTYRPMLPGQQLPQQIPYWFDEVYALRVEERENEDGNKESYRVLQTDKDYRYHAKSRSGVLDQFEEPSIKTLVLKIEGKMADLEKVYLERMEEFGLSTVEETEVDEKEAEFDEGDEVEEANQEEQEEQEEIEDEDEEQEEEETPAEKRKRLKKEEMVAAAKATKQKEKEQTRKPRERIKID